MQSDQRRAFDPDQVDRPGVTLTAHVGKDVEELPWHHHRKGQLVLALTGTVVCRTSDGLWTVPPRSAVWIPGGVVHSNQASEQAQMVYLFIAPGAAVMPGRCCTLLLSALVREMILRIASLPREYGDDSHTARLVQVLLTELSQQPPLDFYVPMPDEPRLRRMADAILEGALVRRTLREWADELAMSERTLLRLMKQHAGVGFTQWRRQLLVMLAVQKLAAGHAVKRVAAELGYESVSAFVYRFRTLTGVTPGQFLQAR